MKNTLILLQYQKKKHIFVSMEKEHKNKTLINDDRLTPTMKRTRSGKTQMFREPNIDRCFTNEDNAAAVLEHPTDVAMYAELIDGEWYWVSGCAECIGEERDWMTYVECDKHNRCSKCSTNSKDLGEDITRWGGKQGWTCSICKEARDTEIRREAFEKFNEEEYTEWDFYSTDDIKCPHCGSKIYDEEMHESEDIECGVCEGEVHVEVEYSRTFTTSIKGKRVTE